MCENEFYPFIITLTQMTGHHNKPNNMYFYRNNFQKSQLIIVIFYLKYEKQQVQISILKLYQKL